MELERGDQSRLTLELYLEINVFPGLIHVPVYISGV
jgi:hypothetical protein